MLDTLLAAWAIVWIALAFMIAAEVRGLRELSDTVTKVGGAVAESGRTLQSLDDLPVLGARVDAPARRIEEAGESAVASGRSSRASVRDLSVLLAIAIAVIPSLPVLGFYVPLRIARAREARALRRAWRARGDDPAFREFLARRAITWIPYRSLAAVSPEPWRDFAEGDYARLAEAELARLGVTRPPGPEPDGR